MDKEYRFNKEKHLHELLVDNKWKSLTGCTTILGILSKPMLIQWSANMAVEYIKGELYDKSLMPPKNMLDGIFERAKTAHRRKIRVLPHAPDRIEMVGKNNGRGERI